VARQFNPDDTRRSYDQVARAYADHIADELANKPFDRAFLDRFADALRGNGQVVELGCGPGHVAACLAGQGLEIAGLDLSQAMVAEAHRLFPRLRFVVGDMLALPFADGALAGTVSFYSIVHFDDAQLRQALAEMARVLRPGGLAALAFHIGDETLHRDEWWDQPVSVDFRFFQPDHVVQLIGSAGFEIRSREERGPYPPDVEFQSRRAYIVAVR
jgi:SAM-dependent methyltransferase